MNLTKKDERDQILKLRQDLMQEARSIGKDEMITCGDLQLLEQVVFDFVPVTLGNEENIPKQYRGKTVYFKYIALDGDTLRNLDLSELSFDDVVWIGSLPSSLKCISELNEFNLYKYIKLPTQVYREEIDFSSMNAKVDLTQSALTKYLGTPVCVSDVNFHGTNLSNNCLKNFIFYSTNLTNTEIVLEFPESQGKKEEWKLKEGFVPIAKCGECDLLSVREDGNYAVLRCCNCNGLKTFANWPTIGWGFFHPSSKVCGCGSSFLYTDIKLGIKEVFNGFHKYAFTDDDIRLRNNKRKLELNELFYNKPPEEFGGPEAYDTPFFNRLRENFYGNQYYFEGTVNMINAIRSDLLNGCRLNGREILSKDKSAAKRAQLKAVLQKLKEQVLTGKKEQFTVRKRKK